MELVETPDRQHHRRNAFGFLRLFFASLVIVSHAPEMIDGNSSREILHRLTGTMTFGGVAVAGFFIISGFLISGSYLNSRSILSYMIKRVARIYPAFMVASLLLIFALAPLVGGTFDQGLVGTIKAVALQIVKLDRPAVSGAFAGVPYDEPIVALNGAAWTIPFEFRCYLLLLLLGPLGMLRRAWIIGPAALVLLLLAAPMPHSLAEIANRLSPVTVPWLDAHRMLLRFVGFFLAGATFYRVQHRLPLRREGVLLAVAGLVLTSVWPGICDIGVAAFGGYLIFAVARKGADTFLAGVNDKTDIS